MRRCSSCALAGLHKAAPLFHAQPVPALPLAEAALLPRALLVGAGLGVKCALWLEGSVTRTHQHFILVLPLHHLEDVMLNAITQITAAIKIKL